MTGKRITFSAALVGVLVLLVTAGIYWKNIAKRYYSYQLENNPGFWTKLIACSPRTTAYQSLEEYFSTEYGAQELRTAFVRAALDDLSEHVGRRLPDQLLSNEFASFEVAFPDDEARYRSGVHMSGGGFGLRLYGPETGWRRLDKTTLLFQLGRFFRYIGVQDRLKAQLNDIELQQLPGLPDLRVFALSSSKSLHCRVSKR